MTSAGENNTFSCSNTSGDGLDGEKTATVFATEHKIPEDVSRVLENKIVQCFSGLQFSNVFVVEMTLSGEESSGENIISKIVTSNSGLISGVYEGGMKIWECTFDLIRYFEDDNVDFEGKMVLGLGCGAAKEVHFQDYNSIVKEEITVPNMVTNCDRDDSNEYITEEPGRKRHKKSEIKPGLLSKCRFFSGEWSQFSKLMQNKMSPVKYDTILTSETIDYPAYYGT
ncbi:hypothetical protein XELAEV_18013214mg [Xenopus laevis]|nr:hypothetical protein XELAEV_18013214mg [Xenopus laevis]